MDFPVCIRLPYLRHGGLAQPIPGALHLWPGHGSAPDHSWEPQDYPLSPAEANAFLKGLASLSVADLEIMRNNLTSIQVSTEIGIQAEMAELAGFASCAPRPDGNRLAAIQAQKALLWDWIWEGSLDEIARLEAECNAAERRIPSLFHEPDDFLPPPVHADELPFPSWRPLVANACVFIPPEIPILAEGPMAAGLLEDLEFSDIGDNIMQAVASLWQALGHTRPSSPIYNAQRIWLVSQA